MPEKGYHEPTQDQDKKYNMPLRIHRQILEWPQDYFPLHWHDEIEFTYVLEGQGIYTIDSSPYEVKAGDIVIVSPQKLHHVKALGESAMVCDVLIFNLRILNNEFHDESYYDYFLPAAKEDIYFTPVIHCNDICYPLIKSALLPIFEQSGFEKSGASLFLKAHLFTLYGQLFSNTCYKYTKENPTAGYFDNFKPIITYIKENYSSPITVDMLAELSGYSRYHFLRYFKKCTGTTCTQFINHYRLERACDLLIHTEDSISHICEAVGIDNVSYFIKIFSKQYHMTPLKFRKRFRNDV